MRYVRVFCDFVSIIKPCRDVGHYDNAVAIIPVLALKPMRLINNRSVMCVLIQGASLEVPKNCVFV